MAEIILRHAKDDFHVLQVARGMEEAGCYVFSITHVPDARPKLRWIVWGRFHPTETDFDAIDNCINRRLFPTSEEN